MNNMCVPDSIPGVGGDKEEETLTKEELQEQEKARQAAIKEAEHERRVKYKKQEDERKQHKRRMCHFRTKKSLFAFFVWAQKKRMCQF